MQYSAGSFVSRLCVMLEDKGSQAHAEHTSGSDTKVLRVELASNSISQRSCVFLNAMFLEKSSHGTSVD